MRADSRALQVQQRRQEAARLYREGLTIYEVAERCGVTSSTVWHGLVKSGVIQHVPRPRSARRRPAPPLPVPVGRAALAFTPERGWHLISAPPRWLLELLDEAE